MFVKAAAVGLAFACAPLCLVSSTQDPEPAGRQEIEELRREIDQLRMDVANAEDRVTDAEQRTAQAEKRSAAFRAELHESLDLLQQNWVPRNPSCRPSRSLLTYYQWLETRGHTERAEAMLERAVVEIGDDPGRLNSLAWTLMTDKECAGKFDRAALALAGRMQRNGRQLSHRQLDTAALAHFLNGQIDEAIRLQKNAIERGGRDDDYRRRLRTYEAARDRTARPDPGESAEEPAERPRGSIHE